MEAQVTRITIREIEQVADFQRCQDLQKIIWGFSDLLVVPYAQLVTIQRHGGAVLGAYDGQTMIGFVYGFLGRHEGRWCMVSQRMGVLPDYRGQAVGYRLKLAQRDKALAQGVDLMVWTFDPLEGRNAHLNIEKLGVVARHYKRDVYGQVKGSSLQGGLGTDRLLVEWHLNSDRVKERIEGRHRPPDPAELLASARSVNDTALRADGWLRSAPPDLGLDGDRLLVEIPPDTQALKAADIALGREWRAVTRAAFEGYFERGYTVSEFATGMVGDRRRNLYVLQPRSGLITE